MRTSDLEYLNRYRRKIMKGKIYAKAQQVGKTFMLPISLLPIAGLFLGLGASFTGPTFIKLYHLESILSPGMPLNRFLSILNDCGSVVFDNLGLLFAVSIALGMAKSEKGVAALSAVVGYFLMYASLTSSIKNLRDLSQLKKVNGLITNVLGFNNTMNLGVFGGIIIGLIVVWLHNKYYNIKLPDVISFFGGTHFPPIAAAVSGVIIGILLSYIWPYFAAGISTLGFFIAKSGVVGSFLYGLIYRMLIPFGLHHIFYLPFWQTAVGGTAVVAGHTVQGAQNIVFAQLAAGGKISYEAARFFSFQFPEMIFGLPAAALAMYSVARKDKRSEIKGLLVSSAVTSILTGITEPLEFTILFASPFLYFGVHCVLFAFSAVFVTLLKVGVGFTFSGGLIDFILYGVLPGNARTNWVPVIFLGIAYFVVYYFLFRFVITKFDLNTPGRKEDTTLKTKKDYVDNKKFTALTKDEQVAYEIVAALGGTDNLVNVDNCATRLRVTVKDGNLVDKETLTSTGAAGTVVNGASVQVIYGTTVGNIKTNVMDLINSGRAPKNVTNAVKPVENPEPMADEKTAPKVVDKSSSQKIALFAPADGQLESLPTLNDGVFSKEMVGKGFAILPENGNIYAPVDGTITTIFPTKHAIGIKDENGIEYLLHMGLDTVELKGKGFKILCSEKEQVHQGDKLAEMNLTEIKSAGKATDVIFVATLSDRLLYVKVLENGKVAAKDQVAQLFVKK